METQLKTHKVRNTILLLLTALIWGAAFVAQSVVWISLNRSLLSVFVR